MKNNIDEYLSAMDRRRFLKLGVGGGAAGIAMANRFSNSLQGANITMLGARQPHIYQPGQTLVASNLWIKAA